MVTTCPDTGATQTVIHEDSARRANLVIDPPGTKISTASGGGMKAVGESDMCLQYKHHKHYTTAFICSDLKFTILVAWQDLQPLHVIFKSFPACICATHHEPIQKGTLVRSFLGLANQLSGFVPDCAHMTVKLRELTSKKNQKEFEQVKSLLSSDMVVKHFNPSLPVMVLTDAPRLHGI